MMFRIKQDSLDYGRVVSYIRYLLCTVGLIEKEIESSSKYMLIQLYSLVASIAK